MLKLLVELGEFASIYQDVTLRNLTCETVEADEIWSFVGAKAADATKDGQGDGWTYTDLCADSKLMISWLVGPRTCEATRECMADLVPRLANRVQLTTDGLRWYPRAVEEAFGWNGCDYAQIKKEYGTTHEGPTGGCYSLSPVMVGVEKMTVMGNPDDSKVSTSTSSGQTSRSAWATGASRASPTDSARRRRTTPTPFADVLLLQLLPPAHDADQERRRSQDNASDGSSHFQPHLDGRGNT